GGEHCGAVAGRVIEAAKHCSMRTGLAGEPDGSYARVALRQGGNLLVAAVRRMVINNNPLPVETGALELRDDLGVQQAQAWSLVKARADDGELTQLFPHRFRLAPTIAF